MSVASLYGLHRGGAGQACGNAGLSGSKVESDRNIPTSPVLGVGWDFFDSGEVAAPIGSGCSGGHVVVSFGSARASPRLLFGRCSLPVGTELAPYHSRLPLPFPSPGRGEFKTLNPDVSPRRFRRAPPHLR